MLFNSLEFLFYFPIVTALYFVLRGPARIWFLLAASALFYMAFVPKYLLILLFTIAVDFVAGLALEARPLGSRGRRWILAASLAANLGLLFVFKYYNFFGENLESLAQGIGWPVYFPRLTWALPLGLSFHTFQAMAYTIEVYWGRQRAERNLAVYSLYVLYYPQLVAGPIERPQELLPQLHADAHFSGPELISGLRLMLWGFFKKLVIADRITGLVDATYADPSAYPGPILAAAVALFSFQIYCDFSGYTDIARGASQAMGIRLVRNFNHPYLSRSVTEFWRRWHISLSSWFRDYLYFPLGGNRAGRRRTYFNLMVVFVVSGFWHGASWTFMLWGALHGMLLCGETLLGTRDKARRGPAWLLVTFVWVSAAWILFRAPDVKTAFSTFKGLFTAWTLPSFQSAVARLAKLGCYPADILLAIALCGFLMVVESHLESAKHLRRGAWQDRIPPPLRWGIYYAGVFAVLFLGKFTREKFIYFQF